jgi:hypothetical protein
MNLKLTYWSGILQDENGALACYGFNLIIAFVPHDDLFE